MVDRVDTGQVSMYLLCVSGRRGGFKGMVRRVVRVDKEFVSKGRDSAQRGWVNCAIGLNLRTARRKQG